MTQLPKTFDPATIEAKWYRHWEQTGAFRPAREDREPFTIVMPPPNVTGSLHIGHALDNTLQDILIRHARLRGKDALWVVGTDHAGIATQMVVERQLNEQQKKRTDFTREDFVDKVWEWKAESGGTITRQLRRLGASCDWSREQFTMDPHFSRAVVKVFVDLYNQKLIYRDKRLVNWDPGLKTAISDLEVETTEVNGHMWHFKYPLAGGETYIYVEKDADGAVVLKEERDYISIATTRPETMLGDGAVAVHPGDERYRPIVGKLCEIPVGPKEHRRLIPIITDDYPDPDFGSGAVKITGAHDLNDYGVAQRNNIPMYRLMDEVAAMRIDGLPYADAAARAKELAAGATASSAEIDALNLVPDAYRGLDRYEARKKVVADIDAEGLMIKVEDKVIMQPFGDRSNVVIEPMLTDQWYVDAEKLAQAPIKAVRDGRIEIVPKTWEKTFFNWMENIQPWCVSRQLWWGHRIPAWYGPELRDGNFVYAFSGALDGSPQVTNTVAFVAETPDEALAKARDYYGDHETIVIGDVAAAVFQKTFDGLPNSYHISLKRDEDVLDTWFSSALWPFATLGWPDESSPSVLGEGDRSAKPNGGGASSEPAPPSALRAATSPSQVDGEDTLLSRHYPNDVLISGFDILFFWDARMAMQGMHFMSEVPWKTLYLHGLVRAADGSKMSKSKGNTVDPLGLIDRYGADALRFTLAAMESQGRDIKLDEKRVEGYRNFATKLWNAARFCQANGIGASATLAAPPAELAVNRWIIGEVVETLAKLDKAFADFRFDDMADAIYHFTWGTFCDWYLELVKPVLSPLPLAGGVGGGPETEQETPPDPPTPNPSRKREGDETHAVAGWVLDQILVMLHPFMPFITEELWDKMGERPYPLIHAKWPEPDAEVDEAATETVDFAISLISEIRSSRQELNVPPSAQPHLLVTERSKTVDAMLYPMWKSIQRMARVGPQFTTDVGPFPGQTTLPGVDDGILKSRVGRGAIQIHREGFTAALLLEGIIDLETERARIAKTVEAVGKEAASLAARLANPAFVEKAKPEAVEKARADHAEKAAEVERLRAALARLG